MTLNASSCRLWLQDSTHLLPPLITSTTMTTSISSTRFPVIHTPCRRSPSGVARCIDLEWLIEHNLAEWSQCWADLALAHWVHGGAKISAAATPIADTLRAAGIAYVFTTRLS